MEVCGDVTLLSTKLITKEGHEALKKELDYLWREKRPDTTRKVTWAASLGDRSENADYQYNKKLLREIDRRVRYLRKRLEDMRVVEYMPEQEGKVFFGAWVDIENEQGRPSVFESWAMTRFMSAWTTFPSTHPWPGHCCAKRWTMKPLCRRQAVKCAGGSPASSTSSSSRLAGDGACSKAGSQGEPAFLFQPSRNTASGLAFNARRVPNTPAPPINTAPITGSTSNHGWGCQTRSKA